MKTQSVLSFEFKRRKLHFETRKKHTNAARERNAKNNISIDKIKSSFENRDEWNIRKPFPCSIILFFISPGKETRKSCTLSLSLSARGILILHHSAGRRCVYICFCLFSVGALFSLVLEASFSFFSLSLSFSLLLRNMILLLLWDRETFLWRIHFLIYTHAPWDYLLSHQARYFCVRYSWQCFALQIVFCSMNNIDSSGYPVLYETRKFNNIDELTLGIVV